MFSLRALKSWFCIDFICLSSLEKRIKEAFNLARKSSQTKGELALEEVSKILISEKLNAYEQEGRRNEMGHSLK